MKENYKLIKSTDEYRIVDAQDGWTFITISTTSNRPAEQIAEKILEQLNNNEHDQTVPAEKLFDKIDNEATENFKGEINFLDIEEYDDEELVLSYSTVGGWEYDVNAPWGGEEYVEDFAETLDKYDEITDVRYEIDDEELSGYLFVRYDAAKI